MSCQTVKVRKRRKLNKIKRKKVNDRMNIIMAMKAAINAQINPINKLMIDSKLKDTH